MYTPKELYWRDEMTTGIVELDAQHKYLIDTFNDLGHSITGRYDPENINKVLKMMKFYVEWHFSKEEECMERHHCPAARKNSKAHAVFTKKLRGYQKEFEDTGGTRELAIKIHEELTDWIVNHIMIVDSQLLPCSQ
jgi:hemerythrin